MIPPSSPSLLTPTGGRATGVRRLNRVPIILGILAGGSALGALGYTIYLRQQQTEITAKEAASATKTTGGKPPGFLVAGTTTDPSPEVDPGGRPKTLPRDASPRIDNKQGTPSTSSVEDKAREQAWQAYYQQMAQLVSAHATLEQQSRSGGEGGSQPQIPDTPDAAKSGSPYSTGGVNPAGQTGKQAFLKTPGDLMGQDEDLAGSVHGPKQNTIMEGTALPCRISEGATSDMPGQLNAEISTNVYDSMTGDNLLIPQGSRIVTTYDIAVSAGQDRIGVIGQRLIFPDTSSRQLGSMSLADQSGLAGLKDITDTHFWEKFGSALAVSFIGAGAQLSQPQQSAFAQPSGTSAAVGSMTQGMTQFGQAQAQQGSQIPNTNRLRPGLQCLVKLNKDMALHPYVDARL